MAVENVLSPLLQNIYGTDGSGTNDPRLNISGLSKGVLYVSSATCAVSATATQYSTYRFFGLPSNAIVHQLWCTTTGNMTGVTAPTFGIANKLFDYSSTPDKPGGGTQDSNTKLYMPDTSTLSIWSTKSMATAFADTNIVAANLSTLTDRQKRIWELVGSTKDWLKNVDLVVTTNATNSGAAGVILIKAFWSI
jgi:hypothetical protein